VRWADPYGRISWRGTSLTLTPVLGGQPVGLRQTDEDEWDLHYGPLLIGYVLIRQGGPRLERVA
jgi:hypothetical protein